MIVHAKVAKLQRYLYNDEFCRVMRHVEAANDEGLESYDLEIDRLDDDMKYDLIGALETMGYQVVYLTEEERLQVEIGDE